MFKMNLSNINGSSRAALWPAAIAALALLFSSCAPYHSQKGAVTFRQQGKASWYGPGFAGKKTANGERFNPGAMTAAHRTLPFGTTVEVTNLSNDKSVVVRINDRGPFIGGRIIDLSRASAKKIGLIDSGVAMVEVKALGAGGSGKAIAAEQGSEEQQPVMLLASREKPVTRNAVEYLISVETRDEPESFREAPAEIKKQSEEPSSSKTAAAALQRKRVRSTASAAQPEPEAVVEQTSDTAQYRVDDEPF